MTGWDLATPSHNTVVVDGLNQRESPVEARLPTAGSDFLFYAADADFQVVSVRDPRAYPQSTRQYRQTLVVTAGARNRYAISVFEVVGGLQHDQIYHAAPGRSDRWALNVPLEKPPATLLPPSITFLPSARKEEGRWFVQAYGEFQLEGRTTVTKPAVAGLVTPGRAAERSIPSRPNHAILSAPGVRLHILGDTPTTAFTAVSPDPTRTDGEIRSQGREPGRGSLILRRRSEQGEALNSTFVTLFEPVGKGFPPLGRIGRVSSDDGVVVVLVETESGVEYIVVNRNPGTSQRVALPNGRFVSFDGVAVRVREQELVLAGGTFAEGAGKFVSQARLAGAITASVRRTTERGLGWFLTPERLPDAPALAGRTLVIQHGDGTCHVVDAGFPGVVARRNAAPRPGRARIPDRRDATAPPVTISSRRPSAPGPHRFRLGQIAAECVIVWTKSKNCDSQYSTLDNGNTSGHLKAVGRDALSLDASPTGRSIGFDHMASSLFRPRRSAAMRIGGVFVLSRPSRLFRSREISAWFRERGKDPGRGTHLHEGEGPGASGSTAILREYTRRTRRRTAFSSFTAWPPRAGLMIRCALGTVARRCRADGSRVSRPVRTGELERPPGPRAGMPARVWTESTWRSRCSASSVGELKAVEVLVSTHIVDPGAQEHEAEHIWVHPRDARSAEPELRRPHAGERAGTALDRAGPAIDRAGILPGVTYGPPVVTGGRYLEFAHPHDVARRIVEGQLPGGPLTGGALFCPLRTVRPRPGERRDRSRPAARALVPRPRRGRLAPPGIPRVPRHAPPSGTMSTRPRPSHPQVQVHSEPPNGRRTTRTAGRSPGRTAGSRVGGVACQGPSSVRPGQVSWTWSMTGTSSSASTRSRWTLPPIGRSSR